LRLALASSLKVPAVYLLERLGVSNFEDWLANLGFESIAATRGSYGAGLALGNAEVSLEELVRAFAVFPRGGKTLELRFTETQPATEAKQIMSPYSAWIIADILSDRASRFVGFGPAPALATEFPSMFKTGTANQFQHIWALGATANYTVGVWMGNFSGETVIGRTGSSIPARIASNLLKALEQSFPKGNFPPVPGGISEVQICALSGMAAGPYCSGSVREWLPKGNPEGKSTEKLPSACTWHRQANIEYPGEYRAWLAERFRQEQASGGFGAIRLPVSGSVFYFDPAMPRDAQAIRIETAGYNPGALVYVNDVLLGGINHAGVFILPLSRGLQRIVVEDENSSSTVEITVR
jgi:penicillin-binding protein 1C